MEQPACQAILSLQSAYAAGDAMAPARARVIVSHTREGVAGMSM